MKKLAEPALAIDPRSASLVVPSRFRRLRVAKQSAADWACGVFAVATASRVLCPAARRLSGDSLLDSLAPTSRERVAKRISPDGEGLHEKDLRDLVRSAGLTMYRPNQQTHEQFTWGDSLWIALVRARFTPPKDGEPYEANHYLLVLQYVADDQSFVVADPHPWNPNVYSVAEADFVAGWRAAKRKGTPWAAVLYVR